MEKKEKIAVIEDNESLSGFMNEVLRLAGFEVINASDGEGGMALVKSQKPDLVLLDILMPKTDGLALLKKLKEDSETKSIPVIMLTALGSADNIAEATALGAAAFMVKGSQDTDEMIRIVEGVLKEKRIS